MSVLDTVAEYLGAAGDRTTEESAGAYWCHDCDERVLDLHATEEPPTCPTCGDEMEFEPSRSSSGCAC